MIIHPYDFNQVPLSQRFNPNKKRKSSPWWAWLGIGSASSTSSNDYEGVINQKGEGELESVQHLPTKRTSQETSVCIDILRIIFMKNELSLL